MILSGLPCIQFSSVWQAKMSLLTISRSSFTLRYPITCFSNDSISSSGAFSPVELFLGNKCWFHCAWFVLKPEMVMFYFWEDIAQDCRFWLPILIFAYLFQSLSIEVCLPKTIFERLPVLY